MKERNLSLELVKFLAVITVANHWFSSLYVKWGFLATGGAIGDVLFFFASGYTLFLGRFDRFDNWYKRRIKRIFPSIIAFATLLSISNVNQLSVTQIICGGDYWFVKCIMLYYIVLYFVRKFAERKPLIPFLISVVTIVVWYLFEDSSTLFMYGATYFKWGHYFLFMLVGEYLGNKTIEFKAKPLIDSIMLLVSLGVFYGIQIVAKRNVAIAHFQIVSLLPLMAIVIYVYMLCSADFAEKMMRTKFGLCLRFVSGLCLEIYIVNSVIVHFMEGKLTSVFPLNLPVTFIMIVALAYVTRCVGRIFVQIFQNEEFNWKAVFEPIIK